MRRAEVEAMRRRELEWMAEAKRLSLSSISMVETEGSMAETVETVETMETEGSDLISNFNFAI